MVLFKDQYRIQSTRLCGRDYSASGSYFVTLCTKDRVCLFGDVVEGQVRLSVIGGIVPEEWQKTKQVRPKVELDQWQIMPNHLHGIIVIKDVETARRAVSTQRQNQSRLRSSSLGSIIGQFKSACTKSIWTTGFRDFAWQTRFYDHVIRSQASLEKIRDYILHNPLMWETDKDNPENLYM